MRNVNCLSGLGATLFCAGLMQPVCADPGDVWRKPVTIDVRDLNTDDYLIELGRAADIDIVADVTQPLDDEPLLSVRQKGVVAGIVNQLVGTREMMTSPFDERTLLWWPTPDRAEIARQIRAQRGHATWGLTARAHRGCATMGRVFSADARSGTATGKMLI